MNRPWLGIVLLGVAAALCYTLLGSTRWLKIAPKAGGSIGGGLLQAKICDVTYDCKVDDYPGKNPFGSLAPVAHKIVLVGAGIFGLAALLALVGWPGQALRRAFPEVIMGLVLLALTGLMIGKILNDGGELGNLGLGFGLAALSAVFGLVGGTLVASHYDIASGSRSGSPPDALTRFEQKYRR